MSLGNFGTNLAIARYFSPAEYGQFVLIWAFLLFVNNLHSSLIVYPFTVQKAGRLKATAGGAIWAALTFTIVFAAAELLFLYLALWKFHLLPLLPAVCSCLLSWQVQEVCRRSLLSELAFGTSVVGDFIAYPGQVFAIVLLKWGHLLTLETVFWGMTATSAAAALLQFLQQHDGWRTEPLREAAGRFWSLGRWGFANNMLGLVAGPLLIWTLSAAKGLAAAAYLQALISVLGVTHPILFGIGNAIVPSVARAHASLGLRAAWAAALTFARHGSLLFAPYVTLLLAAPALMLALFYGRHSPYLTLTFLVRLMCVNYSFMFVSQILDGLANGLRLPKINFQAQAVATALAATLVLPGAYMYGLTGAVLGLCLINAMRMVTQFTLLRRSSVAGIS